MATIPVSRPNLSDSAPLLSPSLSAARLAQTRHNQGINKKLIVCGLVAIIAIVVLIVASFRANTVNVLSTTQVVSQGVVAYGQQVRIEAVVTGPIRGISNGSQALFTISDGKTKLPVRYADGLPDGFRDGTKVSVQGALGPDGTFVAATMTAKCPTKYQAVPNTGQ